MGDLKDSSTLQWLQLMQTDSSYTKQLLADTLGRAGHGALCRMPKWIFNSLLAFAPSLFPILVLSAPDGGCWRLALYICMSFRNCRLYTLEERNSGEVASWWQSSFLEKKKKTCTEIGAPLARVIFVNKNSLSTWFQLQQKTVCRSPAIWSWATRGQQCACPIEVLYDRVHSSCHSLKGK